MKLSATFLPQSITPRIEPQKIDASTGIPVTRVYVERPAYDGPVTITPTAEEQVLSTNGFRMTSDITVGPIPNNYGLITWNGSVLTVS